MATVTLNPNNGGKPISIEIDDNSEEAKKLNADDGTLSTDEQSVIQAKAGNIDLAQYEILINGKAQSLATADSSAKPAEKRSSGGGVWSVALGPTYQRLMGHSGPGGVARVRYDFGDFGVEGEVGYHYLSGSNNSTLFGLATGANATYNLTHGIYLLGGASFTLIDSPSDKCISEDLINQTIDSQGGTPIDLPDRPAGACYTDAEESQIATAGGPQDLRDGVSQGLHLGGATFHRTGKGLMFRGGAGWSKKIGQVLGLDALIDVRATAGTSYGEASGNAGEDDALSIGGNVDFALGATVVLQTGSAAKKDHDKDGIDDVADRCDFSKGDFTKPEGKVDQTGEYKGCNKADKDELAAKAVITEKDSNTGISTHTVKTEEVPPGADVPITAHPGDTIIVEGPDGKGWEDGTKVTINGEEQADLAPKAGDPVTIPVPKDAEAGENTIEILDPQGKVVVRIKLTVEEQVPPIEDVTIDRVVVSSKDPNPEVRVTMTSPVPGKLTAEFRKKGDANAKPIPADVEPGEIKEEQVGQSIEVKVTAKEKLSPGEYDLIINVVDDEGRVVATATATAEQPIKAVNKDELTAAVKMGSASDDPKTANLIEVNSGEKVDFRIEMSKPTAKVTMRILSLDQYGEVSGEVGRDDAIGTVKGRKIDGKYVVERTSIDLPELDGGDEGTKYKIVLEIEDADGMKVTPEIDIFVLPGKPTKVSSDYDATPLPRAGATVTFTFNRGAAGKKGKISYQAANGGTPYTENFTVGGDNSFSLFIGSKKQGGKFGRNLKSNEKVKYTIVIDGETFTGEIQGETYGRTGGNSKQCKPGQRKDPKTGQCK
jgi:hypothetical protein